MKDKSWSGINQPTARATREYMELNKPENSDKAQKIINELKKYSDGVI